MTEFINKLEKDFNIQIVHSDKCIKGTDTFSINKENNIRSLHLYEVELKSLDILLPIANSIVELSLRDANIQDLTKLKYFTNLEELNLSLNPLLPSSFNHISQLKKLKYLDLSATDLQNTETLAKLKSLEFLYIGFNSDIEEVKNLEPLSSLKHLGLEFSGIKRIKDISASNTIQTLNLKGSKVEDMNGLSKFHNLIELNLSGNPIEKIKGLNQLKQLKKLNLSSINVDKIEGLQDLANLNILDLSNNELKEIIGLNSLIELRELNLSENNIHKIANINNLINLEHLLLDYNKINNLNSTILPNIKTQCTISLCHNPITTIDKSIPNNINIKFTDSNHMPKALF